MNPSIQTSANGPEGTVSYFIPSPVFSGRPENPDGRLPVELRTYDLLDSLSIP